MKQIARRTFTARSSELQHIRSMIRCACSTLGYTQTDCDRVALAVDEACTNVIRHGYVERANGLLEVALAQIIHK